MTLALARDVTATETEDGMVLLNERDGKYWQLNRTGAATLRLLLDGHPPEDAAARLVAGRPELSERVRTDVRALLGSLRAAGLVVTA
ncbi:lasso peptide biosynthesis PqqD family chaperone [Actinophytocola oryzae]|uniref:Coenzyme PQQ synthesis protein D (PqqD) n=1 Tax=Actinophytocola oryzae TaxID=502181 RepID=A0A4V3FT21_9PSEU|nr:lasso peptide biosynthesis PqqD family chaperone [Actinophytocola oryzae]TDV49671.1 coenzyme PQQ synthesis protein D (PqqD) [Actinophytocola oryzae]